MSNKRFRAQNKARQLSKRSMLKIVETRHNPKLFFISTKLNKRQLL